MRNRSLACFNNSSKKFISIAMQCVRTVLLSVVGGLGTTRMEGCKWSTRDYGLPSGYSACCTGGASGGEPELSADDRLITSFSSLDELMGVVRSSFAQRGIPENDEGKLVSLLTSQLNRSGSPEVQSHWAKLLAVKVPHLKTRGICFR